ncbi:MAG TPA: hypothetical protein VMY43_11920 [Methanothrix sp.]|nr:hypothetical protein [Methanothrix sp.]
MNSAQKACPFVARECLQESCMAWRQRACRLLPDKDRPSSFEQELINAAPLMYRSLLDLVRIMEDTASDCGKCGPDLYSYAQKVRADLLDELISSELAGVGIKADK